MQKEYIKCQKHKQANVKVHFMSKHAQYANVLEIIIIQEEEIV